MHARTVGLWDGDSESWDMVWVEFWPKILDFFCENRARWAVQVSTVVEKIPFSFLLRKIHCACRGTIPCPWNLVVRVGVVLEEEVAAVVLPNPSWMKHRLYDS